jgi:hypothetical protein
MQATGSQWSAGELWEACPALVGVDGAGVMLMSGDVQRGSPGVTGEVSALIEELQFTLGEGPCVDAYQQDRVVTEADLADPAIQRWPAFTPRSCAPGYEPYSASRCGSAPCAWAPSTSTGTSLAR